MLQLPCMSKQNKFILAAFVVFVGVTIYMFSLKDQESTSNIPVSTIDSSQGDQKNDTLKDNTSTTMDTKNTLQITVLKEGTGTQVSKNGDILEMNYTGTLENGTAFDSTVDPKFGHVKPFEFQIGTGMVIKGWEQGLLNMKKGEKRKLSIPSDLAYGAYSPSPLIPANSNLIFEVELLKINGK